jgi:hypothetical protein
MNQTAAKEYNPVSSQDWDALRSSLKGTVMATTTLASLAKNIGLKWPIRGTEETPERYINCSLEELGEMPEFFGKGNRLPLLYSILEETMRLDDPFAEMIEGFDVVEAEAPANPTILQDLQVPEEFPVELMNFSRRTRTLCREGGHETVSELLEFLKKSTSAAAINDEFQQFLYSVERSSVSRLKQFIPVREGSKGVHLVEAIALIGRRLNDQQVATLLYAYKISTTNCAWDENAVLPKAQALNLIKQVSESVGKACDLLPEQGQELREAVEGGVSSSVRYFVPLGDPEMEGLAIALSMAAMDVKPRIKGLIGSLLK